MGNVNGNFQEVVLMYKSPFFINNYLSLQAVPIKEILFSRIEIKFEPSSRYFKCSKLSLFLLIPN